MIKKTLQHNHFSPYWEGAFQFADELGPAKITHIKVQIEVGADPTGEHQVVVFGRLEPAMQGERLRVDVAHTTDYLWTADATTDGKGEFSITTDLAEMPELDDQLPPAQLPLSGTYKVQAHTINSPNAAEASSNIVYFQLP